MIGNEGVNTKTSIVFLWMALSVTAWARLGETKLECMDRYGQAIASLPGIGNLTGVDVYMKDDIAVSLFFVRTTGQDARCGLVIYSRLRPEVQSEPPAPVQAEGRSVVLPAGEITTNEQATLLGMMPGRWEDYAPPPSLVGRPDKVIALGGMLTPTTKNRNSASSVVKQAYEVLYPPHKRVMNGSAPKDIAHNGSKEFAFRIGGGVALCSCDAVPAIAAWADYMAAERAKASRKKDGLRGL